MSDLTAGDFFAAGAFGGPLAEAMYVDAAQSARDAAMGAGEPFVVYGATLAPDGNMWSALLGENIQEGVVGFGKTPAEAVADFNNNWWTQQTPEAIRFAKEAPHA